MRQACSRYALSVDSHAPVGSGCLVSSPPFAYLKAPFSDMAHRTFVPISRRARVVSLP